MQSKFWVISFSGIIFIMAAYAAYKDYEARDYRNQASFFKYENNMLMGEINILEAKPNYNDGYRDAIIKMGGPQSPGSYQDGWDAAVRVLGDKSYSEGYHNAIKQFGYTKEGSSRWLIEDFNQSQTPSQPVTKPVKK